MKARLELIVVPDPEVLAEVAASRIAGAIEKAAATHLDRPVAVALAGGSTPRLVYGVLAQVHLSVPWDRVMLYFGDERGVPADAPESNFRMAKEALIDRLPVAPAAVHRMEGERDDPDLAARDYEARLPVAFDLVLLGIGDDGHCASLFPGSPALREEQRRVVATRSPSGAARLTLTPPVLRNALDVIVMAQGEGKAGVVARVLEGPLAVEDLPSQIVRERTWIIDEAAASRLAPTLRQLARIKR